MGKVVGRIISIILIILLIMTVVVIYNRFYFNDFMKAHEKNSETSFYRDSNEKYNGKKSYCIENKDYNDSLFFKTIDVEKDTPYKVTCMIKTENVESDIPETAGACISIMGTSEQTIPIQGTTDWQQVTLLVDSKNSETLDISFRLGGYDGYSKGKAWFSDIHVEKGVKDTTTNWNVVCFLMDSIDVELNGKSYTYSLTDEDKTLLKSNVQRFADSCKSLSGGSMTVTYDVIEITDSIKTLSYDEENYYYVSSKDVKPLIDEYVKADEYDHIFVGIRMGDAFDGIPVNEWIGLGSMRYDNIGFSDIRMPNDLKNSTMYKYDIRNDIFPEEVFIHEFLHSLERNLNEKEFVFPALHDNEKFGYESQAKAGLKQWYEDYMKCNIASTAGKTGLDSSVYIMKPVHESNFDYAEEIEFENNPNNPIEIIKQIIGNIKTMINKEKNGELNQTNYITITSD